MCVCMRMHDIIYIYKSWIDFVIELTSISIKTKVTYPE